MNRLFYFRSVAVLDRRFANDLPNIGGVRKSRGYHLVHLGHRPLEFDLMLGPPSSIFHASASAPLFSLVRLWWVHGVLISRPPRDAHPAQHQPALMLGHDLAPLTKVRSRRPASHAPGRREVLPQMVMKEFNFARTSCATTCGTAAPA